jgi:hypothetical protein
MEAGEAAGRTLLDRSDRPTAIFAVNDNTAIGVMAAVHACGLRIPATDRWSPSSSTRAAAGGRRPGAPAGQWWRTQQRLRTCGRPEMRSSGPERGPTSRMR